ncbi:uncharacterized protein LOC130694513 [Daphnia carinata]|uniref:uncharacterized protein LOC130694513 n=1 Tax=Daphnia carinata TaxID=120202 RepID=UPI002580CA1C|nr:uncharacterized protein LOC130694513 [Daphnia carinata]XP_057373570.1 uncharacterized protein LOC130694513 [Daphnia carinata]
MPEFFCGPCNIQLNSKFQWDQHLTGGKHMRAAALKQPQTVDLSAAIALPDGNYRCKICNDFVGSGRIPFEQHVIGQKHMKNVQRATESPIQSPSSSPLKASPLPSTPILKSVSTPETATDFSLAMVQPDGSYKCKVCVDFTCTGPIPMEAHLKGKSHLKNWNKSHLVESLPFEQLNLSSPNRIDSIPIDSTADERVEKAWNHQTMCGYSYDECFPSLSVGEKIEVLNPHFAFIGKDDPMPNFIKYLSM